LGPYEGQTSIITGNGKGKTTTALGIALQYWGRGKKVLILQFIKGASEYGELKASRTMGPDFDVIQVGLGFVGRATGDELTEHKNAARQAIEQAKKCITSGAADLIVLDEVLYCIKFGLISTEDVIENMIKPKPASLALILTGRDAPPSLIDLADIVIEAVEIKHHYQQGIKAQPGIEF